MLKLICWILILLSVADLCGRFAHCGVHVLTAVKTQCGFNTDQRMPDMVLVLLVKQVCRTTLAAQRSV